MGEKDKITAGNTLPIVKSPFASFWAGTCSVVGYYRQEMGIAGCKVYVSTLGPKELSLRAPL